MIDKKPTDSRRKLLKSIAAGSGAIVAGKSLPESWSKPVVDSIVLPAHAETSETAGGIYSVTYTRLNDGQRGPGNGQTQPDFDYTSVCAVVSGDMAEITFQPMTDVGDSTSMPGSDVVRYGTIPTNNTWGTLDTTHPDSCAQRATVPARITFIDGTTLTLEIERPNGNNIIRDVPKASACFTVFTPICNF